MQCNSKVSICIPTYEMNRRGVAYLDMLLQTVLAQTYTNYEVIISDHSENDSIEKYCEKVSPQFKCLCYLRNLNNRGSASANLNNAMIHATGDIIKPIFQDDAFYTEFCLEKIVLEMQSSPNMWGGMGFIHVDDVNRPFLGRYHSAQYPKFDADEILKGENIFGCPSIMFFKREVATELFDTSLVWLMDTEYYYRLWKKFGQPSLIEQYDMAVRIWGNSVTKTISEEVKEKELQYVLNKHKVDDK